MLKSHDSHVIGLGFESRPRLNNVRALNQDRDRYLGFSSLADFIACDLRQTASFLTSGLLFHKAIPTGPSSAYILGPSNLPTVTQLEHGIPSPQTRSSNSTLLPGCPYSQLVKERPDVPEVC